MRPCLPKRRGNGKWIVEYFSSLSPDTSVNVYGILTLEVSWTHWFLLSLLFFFFNQATLIPHPELLTPEKVIFINTGHTSWGTYIPRNIFFRDSSRIWEIKHPYNVCWWLILNAKSIGLRTPGRFVAHTSKCISECYKGWLIRESSIPSHQWILPLIDS